MPETEMTARHRGAPPPPHLPHHAVPVAASVIAMPLLHARYYARKRAENSAAPVLPRCAAPAACDTRAFCHGRVPALDAARCLRAARLRFFEDTRLVGFAMAPPFSLFC